MTLKDELMDIQGVGEARADEILRIVDAHTDEDANRAIDKALTFFDRDKPAIAESVLREYRER